METAIMRTTSAIESILFVVFRGNNEMIKLLFHGGFKNKSLRECISYLKELGELSEEIFIRIIEETHQYHHQNYEDIQEKISLIKANKI